MKSRLLILALAATLSGCASLRAPEGADVYHGFTLIDPASERRIEHAWLMVKDGHIVRSGSGPAPSPADPARSHDLGGRFVMPGFIDAHAHITHTGILGVKVKDGMVSITQESVDDMTQYNGRIALARGVTTVRNPGGDPEANARYDRMRASGAWLGPEARHAGAVMEPPPFSGSAFAYPRSEAEWDAEAKREADLGMTYFKLYIDLTEPELAAGINAAHRHGLKAIAHLNTVSWSKAIELGIDGLEHALPTSPDLLEPEARATYVAGLGRDSKYMYRWFELADFDGPLIRRLVAQLAEKKVVVDLTLTVNYLVYNIDRFEQVVPPIEMEDTHPDLLKVLAPQMKASAAGWTAEDYTRARAVMPKVLQFAKLLHDAGVPMMIGTDAGGGTYYAGELALHRQAGIPAWDVLRMATSETAEIMGMGARIGRIANGFEADLVVLDGDPVADIGAAGKVFAVVTDGKFHLTADLRRKGR